MATATLEDYLNLAETIAREVGKMSASAGDPTLARIWAHACVLGGMLVLLGIPANDLQPNNDQARRIAKGMASGLLRSLEGTEPLSEDTKRRFAEVFDDLTLGAHQVLADISPHPKVDLNEIGERLQRTDAGAYAQSSADLLRMAVAADYAASVLIWDARPSYQFATERD